MQHAAAAANRAKQHWSKWCKRAGGAELARGNSYRAFAKFRLGGSFLALALLFSASIAPAAVGRTTTQRPPGYLGIEFHDLTREQAEALHLRGPQGVEVLLVDHDGPAAAAGLRPHDLVTGFNGHVVPSGEALRRMIRETGAGVMVTLSVFRNGDPITIRTRLANQEDIERKAWQRLIQPESAPSIQGQMIVGPAEPYVSPAATPPAAAPRSEGFIGTILHGESAGLVVEAMQPQLRNYFGAPKGQGLLVQSVADGSAAAVAGLQAGDVLVRADGQPMRAASDWSRQLRASKGKAVTLDVVRDRQELTLVLPAESKKH